MRITTRTRVKRIVSRLLPDSARLRLLAQLPALETWRCERARGVPLLVGGFELFEYLASHVIDPGTPVTYLEFGVFEGKSMRKWLSLNSNPKSSFVGFDTFSGLPDAWGFFHGQRSRGEFDAGGRAPAIDDPRVSFVPGLFQDTLPSFLASFAPKGRLVVNIDCDLYASALYVLTRCHDILVPGAIILFDEFSSVLHEFRALEDYCAAYRRDYEVIGATVSAIGYYGQVAVRMR